MNTKHYETRPSKLRKCSAPASLQKRTSDVCIECIGNTHKYVDLTVNSNSKNNMTYSDHVYLHPSDYASTISSAIISIDLFMAVFTSLEPIGTEAIGYLFFLLILSKCLFLQKIKILLLDL